MEGIELLKRQACNPMWQRLQPYVAEAPTLCGRGCIPMWQRLQPQAAEAATLCGRACNPCATPSMTTHPLSPSPQAAGSSH